MSIFLGNTDIDLLLYDLYESENLVVTNVAGGVGFSTSALKKEDSGLIKRVAKFVICQVSKTGESIRTGTSDTAPTATTGKLYHNENFILVVKYENCLKFRAIRTGSVNVDLHVDYYK